MTLEIAAVAAFTLALAGTALLARRRIGLRVVGEDQDRWRSDAVPRVGGIAILAGFALGSLILVATGDVSDSRAVGFLGGALIIVAVGLYDDLRGLRPLGKLTGQILATALLLVTGTTVEIVTFEPAAIVLTFVWVVAMTNALNLLDNMDGLAGGIALVSLVVLAVHGDRAGLTEVVLFAVVLAAALAGFLPFNFPLFRKASIYMGDGGSQLLGFGLAWLALAASWHSASGVVSAVAIPLLVLAIPILDTSLVSLVRLIEGRPISQGGRDHTSHRLVFYGLSERRAVFVLVGISALLGASSLLWVEWGAVVPALIGLAISVVLLLNFAIFLVKARKRMEFSSPDLGPGAGGWVAGAAAQLQKRRVVEALIDLVLICAAYYIAYVLRYDQLPDELNEELIAESIPIVVAARFVSFWAFGLYRGLWRYAGVREVARVLAAVIVSEAAIVAVLTWAFRFEDYSRTVFIINALLCFVFIAGARLAERALSETLASQRTRKGIPSALIVGAGDAGNSLLRELRHRGEYVIAGFVDDDPTKRGVRTQGVPVIGDHTSIELAIDRYRPEVVYVTIPDAPAERLERIERACARGGCRYAIVRPLPEVTGSPPSEPPLSGPWVG